MSILNHLAARPLPKHVSRLCRASLALVAAGFALAGCGGGGGSGGGNPGSGTSGTGTTSGAGTNGGGTSGTGATGTSATPVATGTVVAQNSWTVVNAANVQPTKPWTFLVYMDGANDLDSDALFNFNQLESVGSSANVNIVVQFKRGQGQDLYEDYTYDNSEGGWGGTRRYYVTKDSNLNNISSFLLSTNANSDMGNYQTLQQFVQWGVATYPATHYALVIWDHGSGWRAESIPGTRATSIRTKSGKTTRSAIVTTSKKQTGRGVAFDDVSGDYILTTQLGAAVDMGNGKKWDLIAWDCSLMQMAENDYEIKDKTLWIVGSEESPPGDGYPYDTMLSDLTANPTWDGKAFGIDIAQKNLAYYVANPYIVQNADTFANVSIGPNFVTQSVIDATQLAGVTAAINNLGAALSNAEPNFGSQIATARLNTEEYGVDDVSPTDDEYEFYGSYRDPVDFVHQLIDTLPGASGPLVTDSGVVTAGKALRTAIASAVVETDNGSSHASSHGLSLYIPTPANYATDDANQAAGGEFGYGINVRYGNLDFSLAAPGWQSFVATAKQ